VSAEPGTAIPDSPYAAQLQQGFANLRFVRALEREFQAEFREQHLVRMRTGFAVAVVLYAVFLLLRMRVESGPVEAWSLMLRGSIIGAMLVALVASFVRALQPVLHLVVVATYAVFAVGVTGIEVVAHRYGVDRHYEGLILVSFHVYVFGGLLLRPALVAGALIFVSYLVGGALGGLAGKEWGYQLLFIALTHIIGAGAMYSSERLERDNFLRRRLFGVLASHDGLTGLTNRMAFFQQFERVLRHAAREKAVVAVVLADIDYFKNYNDRYGHLEGDACLRAVAQALREEFRRPLDLIGRYGGEEFIGLWYDVQPQSLRAMADQLRAAVQALKI
jgi:GGDEF domain-containing protein